MDPVGKRKGYHEESRCAQELAPTRRRDAGHRRDPERNTSPLWVNRNMLFRSESRVVTGIQATKRAFILDNRLVMSILERVSVFRDSNARMSQYWSKRRTGNT